MKRAQSNNLIKKICKITVDIGKWTLMGSTIISCAWTGFVAPKEKGKKGDVRSIYIFTLHPRVCKFEDRCLCVSKTAGINAATVSKAVCLGRKLSAIVKIQKQIRSN